jgi:hypothetical protein
MTMGLPRMSSTDPHHGSKQTNHAQHDEHEPTDFNWTLILWSVPFAAIVLVVFTLTCLFFFRGYKDDAILAKAGFVTTDLNRLRVSEQEVLSQYKVLDKDSGRIQIPITRAMELVVAEHQNISGKEWAPITDIYMLAAPFAMPPTKAIAPKSNGISIEEIDAPKPKATHIVPVKTVPKAPSTDSASKKAH